MTARLPRTGLDALGVAFAMLMLLGPVITAADRDRDGLRDGFERNATETDRERRDTDRDGLIDAAEDPDSDGLSNLGEQRFRTDPLRKDTDGDGREDSAEDNDRDGRSNGLEQDQRPPPRRLTPSLADAPTAWPAARARCQTAQKESAIHPCVFGDKRSETLVVLFGDSHATQWLPALARTGFVEGWRVVMLTKTGCPSIDHMPVGQIDIDRGATCGAWRSRAMQWIRKHRPEVVVLSNLGAYRVSDPVWRAALIRTLDALPRRTTRVVLADTPRLPDTPITCLKRNPGNISACVTPRDDALRRSHDRLEAGAAADADSLFMSLSFKVCPYDPCPLVIGDILLWRDHAHITAAFARQLAPSMRIRLTALLRGEGIDQTSRLSSETGPRAGRRALTARPSATTPASGMPALTVSD